MRVLSTSDLLPGDVLLSGRPGIAARLIRLLSGSPYSHAGIFDGAEVVELDPGARGSCVSPQRRAGRPRR